jgi:hypothetical protein
MEEARGRANPEPKGAAINHQGPRTAPVATCMMRNAKLVHGAGPVVLMLVPKLTPDIPFAAGCLSTPFFRRARDTNAPTR